MADEEIKSRIENIGKSPDHEVIKNRPMGFKSSSWREV